MLLLLNNIFITQPLNVKSYSFTSLIEYCFDDCYETSSMIDFIEKRKFAKLIGLLDEFRGDINLAFIREGLKFNENM